METNMAQFVRASQLSLNYQHMHLRKPLEYRVSVFMPVYLHARQHDISAMVFYTSMSFPILRLLHTDYNCQRDTNCDGIYYQYFEDEWSMASKHTTLSKDACDCKVGTNRVA